MTTCKIAASRHSWHLICQHNEPRQKVISAWQGHRSFQHTAISHDSHQTIGNMLSLWRWSMAFTKWIVSCKQRVLHSDNTWCSSAAPLLTCAAQRSYTVPGPAAPVSHGSGGASACRSSQSHSNRAFSEARNSIGLRTWALSLDSFYISCGRKEELLRGAQMNGGDALGRNFCHGSSELRKNRNPASQFDLCKQEMLPIVWWEANLHVNQDCPLPDTKMERMRSNLSCGRHDFQRLLTSHCCLKATQTGFGDQIGSYGLCSQQELRYLLCVRVVWQGGKDADAGGARRVSQQVATWPHRAQRAQQLLQ